MTTQKFKRGSLVHVDKDMPPMMIHFNSDFDAIIQYSYEQEYGGGMEDGEEHKYSLIVLNESGQAINEVAWYYEHQLTLVSADIAKGLAIIEKYEYGQE